MTLAEESWSGVRRLLVARLDNIGDVVLCTPALAALRASLPKMHLTLLVSPGGARVAALVPGVDEVMAERVVWQDVGGRLAHDPAREWELVQRLKARNLDAAIVFTSFSQSPSPLAFLLRLASVPLRAGQSKEVEPGVFTHLVPAPPDAMHQAERNLHLVESLGFTAQSRSLVVSVPDAARESIWETLKKHGLARSTRYVVVHVGASCSARMYSPERFGAVARMIGQRMGKTCLFTGDARELPLVTRALSVAGSKALPLVGETDITEFAALLEGATIVISNNTSTLHLADALLTPLVVLYSGTELEEQWRPLFASHLLLRRSTPCSPPPPKN